MILKRQTLQLRGGGASQSNRSSAMQILYKLSQAARLPAPQYLHEPVGSYKHLLHFYTVRFRVPQFLGKHMEFYQPGDTILGRGKDRNIQYAQSLAALECVQTLEQWLNLESGQLPTVIETYLQEQERSRVAMEQVPVHLPIPGVSWDALPIDPSFGQHPGKRELRIDFWPELLHNETALLGAKALTLCSRHTLPTVVLHAQPTDHGTLQRWANVTGDGLIAGVAGPVGDANLGLSATDATLQALERIGLAVQLQRDPRLQHVTQLASDCMSPFGTAKLFVQWPVHHFDSVKKWTETLAVRYTNEVALLSSSRLSSQCSTDTTTSVASRGTTATTQTEMDERLQSRINQLRTHQLETPLPIDSVQDDILQHSNFDVTMVRGGTGSGKTTRYPLFLSLHAPHAQSRVVVAIPRRLACIAAARRVATEQDCTLGTDDDCPVGYSVRFDARPAASIHQSHRTLDFETPGVVLRRASRDPLLSAYTHIVLDEVHERHADMDLLLSLAKQAQAKRKGHPNLAPLQIVVMSATLDVDHWHKYFGGQSLHTITVPEFERFPVPVLHVGDANFPAGRQIRSILKRHNDTDLTKRDYDATMCQTAAAVIAEVYDKVAYDGGSILCFLPGMEEIRTVHEILKKEKWRPMNVLYLHSSITAQEQARVFEPGPKVILSTNIAETSLTIPDVKVVVDSGRERRLTPIDSSSTTSTTVVGSQLITTFASQASARQRAGRAGRVNAGVVYRLYPPSQLEKSPQYIEPEILRMDVSRLVLRTLALYEPTGSEHPLSLLRQVPDPLPEVQLKRTLLDLAYQGLIVAEPQKNDTEPSVVALTPLGRAVSEIPASPRIGRMLAMGLLLRALDPALNIAALLSVPKVFMRTRPPTEENQSDIPRHSSDVVLELESFQEYLDLTEPSKRQHPRHGLYRQVNAVRRQLAKSMEKYTGEKEENPWNANGTRIGAIVGLICSATPHIAHLVDARRSIFSTRDSTGKAKIHPNSVNFDYERRAHWYVYQELRATKKHPYLHVTTAASPLELALFSDWSKRVAEMEDLVDQTGSSKDDAWLAQSELFDSRDRWSFIADQWVPVDMNVPLQRETILQLKRLLQFDLLQAVVADPNRILNDKDCEQLILYVLSAIEQQRVQL